MRISVAIVRAILLVAIVPLIVACGADLTGPKELVADARTRWSQKGPPSYTMTVSYICECVPEVSTPVNLTVRNGVVTDRRYAGSGAAVDSKWNAQFPAVEGLFAIIDEKLRNNIGVEMLFDPTFWYPLRIAIGNTALDSPIIMVSNFQAQ